MAYFPFMIDIKGKNCLVVGGGKIALRKVLDLLQFDAAVTVISPEISNEIRNIDNITIVKKKYESDDIQNRFLVIAATDSNELNRKIAVDCNSRQILVNAVDIKEVCSFIFPAIIKEEDLVIGISTGGNSPAGAAYLKNKISQYIPEYYSENMKFLGSIRGGITEKVKDTEKRKGLYYELLDMAEKDNRLLNKQDIVEFIKKYDNDI